MTHTHKHTSHARGGTKSDLNKRAKGNTHQLTQFCPLPYLSERGCHPQPQGQTATWGKLCRFTHTHTHEIRDAQVRIVRKLHPLAVVARIHRNKHYVHQHGSCVLFKYAFPLKPKRATPQQKILLKQVDTSILLVCSLVSA